MEFPKHNRHQKIKTGCAVLTVSNTRSEENDESGKLAKKLLTQDGHRISAYKIVKNDKAEIQEGVKTFLQKEEIRVIVISGGTGISRRDVTVDALSELMEKVITGFGEFFRRMSYEEVGEVAMISRAIAGTIGGRIVFCLPGSTNAVRLALTKLILPSLGHMLWEIKR